jgi:acetyl-CoA carboxylase biotin carboxyl carrier protein
MNIEEIKELIQLANESGVAELEVQRGEHRVRIQRAVAQREVVLPAAAPVTFAAAPAAAAAAVASAPVEKDNLYTVKSPIVGTFYEAASPDAAPFVKPGDSVTAKSTVCIIESMKLMNEIEAEVSGTIVARLVENGKPVEYGEALFTIRPN